MVSSYGRLRPGSVDEAAFKIRRLWEQEERQQLAGEGSVLSRRNRTGLRLGESGLLMPVVAPPAGGARLS
jgi:hypothetical protein